MISLRNLRANSSPPLISRLIAMLMIVSYKCHRLKYSTRNVAGCVTYSSSLLVLSVPRKQISSLIMPSQARPEKHGGYSRVQGPLLYLPTYLSTLAVYIRLSSPQFPTRASDSGSMITAAGRLPPRLRGSVCSSPLLREVVGSSRATRKIWGFKGVLTNTGDT